MDHLSTLQQHAWVKRDHRHVIHPYATPSAPILPVANTQGCTFTLTDGTELIDGMASWWSAIHGYNHPFLVEQAKHQLDVMPHVMFGGLTHQNAIELAEKLVSITPQCLQKVFFSDSGSVSIEVAIKMAFQYHRAKGQPRTKLLTIEGGYHGDTFEAMSVCDPVNGMHSHFQGIVQPQYFAPRPHPANQSSNGEDLIAFERLLEKHHTEIAAVILEPVFQNAGGMYPYRAEYLAHVQTLCKRWNILLIVDEIATGFGRLGSLFGCQLAAVEPDIMCVGKALTGGMISLAATLCTDELLQTINEGDPGVLMHGPTFMANPLACRIACANLTLLETQQWKIQITQIESQLLERLEPAKTWDSVRDVRVMGGIGVIELNQPLDPIIIAQTLLKHNVWLRPFGRLIYTMPPYVISPNELNQVCDAMLALARIR